MGRSLCPACNETWTHTTYQYHPICENCVVKLDAATIEGAAGLAYLEAFVDEESDSNRLVIMKILAPHVPLDAVLQRWEKGE